MTAIIPQACPHKDEEGKWTFVRSLNAQGKEQLECSLCGQRVMQGDINRRANLTGTHRALNARDKAHMLELYDDWQERIANHVLAVRARGGGEKKRRAQAREDRKPLTSLRPDKAVESWEAKVQELYDELLDTYEAPSPNDKEDLWQLASLQTRFRMIDTWEVQHHASQGFYDPKAAEDFSKQKSRLSTDIDRLQSRLGIGKAERDKQKEQSTAADVVGGILDELEPLLKRDILEVECPECHIYLFMIWSGFPSRMLEATMVCPHCGKKVRAQVGKDLEDGMVPSHVVYRDVRFLNDGSSQSGNGSPNGEL